MGDVRRFTDGKLTEIHCNWSMFGWEVCPASSQDRLPLQLLMESHGGYDRFQHDHTSNFAIRNLYETVENMSQYGGHGMLHFCRPWWSLHSDTGVMGFYYCQPLGTLQGWNSIELPWRLGMEWQSYCMRFEEQRYDIGKNKLKSNLLLATDGTKKSCETTAHQLAHYGRWVPMEELYARIDNLTIAVVSDVINHYYYDREISVSSFSDYKPDMPQYMTVRGIVPKSFFW